MKIPKLKKWQWVLAGLGALCLGYCGVQQGREVVLNYQASEAREVLEKEESFVRVYYGRISFEVPKNAAHGGEIRLPGSRAMPYPSITLQVEPWSATSDADEQARAAEYTKRWDAFIAQQRANDHPGDEFEIVRDEELEPGVRVLYYVSSGTSKLDLDARTVRVLGNLAAIVTDSEHMKPDAQHKTNPEPAIQLLRERLRSVLARLRPTREVLHQGDSLERVMFVDQVALIDQPFDKEEEHAAGFPEHPLLKGESCGFGTGSEYQAEDPPSLASTPTFIANAAVARAMGVSLTQRRAANRTVGGIEGEEIINEISDSSKQLLHYEWRESGREDASQLHLSMDTKVGDVPRQTALWDHILDSVRWHGPTARRNAP